MAEEKGGGLGGLVAAGVGAVINWVGSWFSSRQQQKANLNLAKYQAQANEMYLDKQLAYNTPKAQMERYQAAGLNPHLAYGQGTPGNQQSPLSFPEIGRTDLSKLGSVMEMFNQSRMVQSQVQATDATVRQKTAVTELNRLQARVVERNPLLNDAGFKAVLDSLKSTAEIKASESGIKQSEMFVQQATAGHQVSKIVREIELLEQKFKLGQLDATVKAQVLKSKEFQNAILEVQKKFLADGEVGAQQVYQFIQLLLMKAL